MARNALGRGLSALIRDPETLPSVTAAAAAPTTAPSTIPATESLAQADIDLIDPSPYQPRTRFPEASLDELGQSIRASGIIQPLIVRRKAGRFELLAGERRWRAAQRAGLARVPVIIRDVAESLALEITLIENLQREDLNPIDQARAFSRLMEEFGMTQEQVANRTGKDRATVANSIRLLRLDSPIQELIEEGKLSAGHGRALLSILESGPRLAVARKAARGSMSVRQLERLATRLSRPKTPATSPTLDANTRDAIENLQRELGTRVTLRPKLGRLPGQLIIEFYDSAQLAGIYDRIMHRT